MWLGSGVAVAVAPTRPLAWGLRYATGAALKRQKKKKKFPRSSLVAQWVKDPPLSVTPVARVRSLTWELPHAEGQPKIKIFKKSFLVDMLKSKKKQVKLTF